MFPPGRTFENKKQVPGEQIQDKNVCRPHAEASPMNEDVKCLDMHKNSAGSLSADEAYSDALDTLLESDTNTWSCSVGGLSDHDGPYGRSSSSFSADPQTQEIMMTRFLPAARVMAVKKKSKKQTMASELPRHIKKLLSGEFRLMLEKYGSNTAVHPNQNKGSVYSEDEDDEFIERGRKSIKDCGLLPRLCVNNSVSLLGLVPVMKSRAQSPIPSVTEYRRMARTAQSGPLPQTHHEMQDWNDVYWKNMQKHIQSRVQKPQSPFCDDGARFLGIPKIVKDNKTGESGPLDRESDKRDFSVHQIYKQLSGHLIALDPLNNAEVSNLDSVSSR